MNSTQIGLLMFPIGAIGGFLCAVAIITVCLFFHFAFYGEPYKPEMFNLYVLYILICGVMPGSILGLIYAPIVYWYFLRELNSRRLALAGLEVIAIIILSGLVGAVLQEFFALIATVIGAIGACFYVGTKYKKTLYL